MKIKKVFGFDVMNVLPIPVEVIIGEIIRVAIAGFPIFCVSFYETWDCDPSSGRDTKYIHCYLHIFGLQISCIFEMGY